MTHSDQSDELRGLREQLAELTRRVYRLEELLRAAHIEPAASPSEQAATASGRVEIPPRPPTAVIPPPEGRPPVPRTARATSLESRIGGQWLNRVGIVAVLVGLSYFLKLAFENNWIGPGARVAIGLLAGIGLLMWSERFRNRGFAGFAFSLKAVGIGALYLSLWAAFQFYHLIPALVAFVAMVLVTITSAVLSLRQDTELLAALALLGGFLTPVLVPTNQNQEVALFCYLALLDLGTIWMVSRKGWRRLLLGSFVGTALLFAAWASDFYTEQQLATTLTFATFFFLLYAAAPLLIRRRVQQPAFANVMIALALLDAACYFAVSYVMLIQHYRTELAWLTVALAVFFFVLTRALQRRQELAGALSAPLYLALAVGFLTIAIPLQFGSYWNTLGWMVEAGALFWAANRARSLLLRVLGVCALLLGIVRLIAVDSFPPVTPFLNSRFGLYLAAIASLALLTYYASEEGNERNRQWAAGAIIAINLLALLALHFEIVDYFQPQFAAAYSSPEQHGVATVQAFTYSAVWMVYGGVLMMVGFWRRSAFLRWQAILLLALTVIKVFLFDIGTLERGYRIVAFIVLGAILLAVSFFYQRSRLKAVE